MMRIVSYNILAGGEGRADPLAEVILAQRADVVALSEAVDLAVLERIAGRLEMDYIQACGPAAQGAATPHAAALLSRYPIRETINHGAVRPGLGASLLEAVVAAPGGIDWVFGVLVAGSRPKPAGWRSSPPSILDVFAEHRRRGLAHVLAGDLPERSALEYVDALSAGGLVSEGAGAETSGEARHLTSIWTFGIDAARIRSAWVETDRLARYASDHYPVGVEIASSDRTATTAS
jgi:hypothetical protein